MKILRKYALRELIVPFLFALGLFTFMFMVGNLVRLADLFLNKGVNVFDVVKLLLLLLPKLLGFTIPMSALTAVLLVFGGFAQNNEIMAMKASGVNVIRVMAPVLLVSFLLSVFSLFLNDQLISETKFTYRKVLKEIFLSKPSAYLEPGRFIKEFKNYVILIQEIHDKKLKGITIYQTEADKPIRTIIAESGEIISSVQDKTLSMKLYHGTIDEANPQDPNVFYKLDFESFVLPPLAVGDAPMPGEINKKTKDMSLDELMTKLPKEHEKKMRRKIQASMHHIITLSLAPFVFVLIGLPLALITRRGEPIISFGIALALICIYYVFFVLSDTMAISGVLPPMIALWLPNITLSVIGCVLLARVVKT
ncbi:MAG: LptF/LptG family permease [Candidatus Omnitrophica bacterium]|nr:LptF/LptG family permease [Candidatus Omnitrophota bacterium]